MSGKYKRINVLITPEQHAQVLKRGLSLSGLLRDLLDDRLSGTCITLSVRRSTKQFYDKIVSNFGAEDKDLEPYLVEALDKLIVDKTKELEGLRKELKGISRK